VYVKIIASCKGRTFFETQCSYQRAFKLYSVNEMRWTTRTSVVPSSAYGLFVLLDLDVFLFTEVGYESASGLITSHSHVATAPERSRLLSETEPATNSALRGYDRRFSTNGRDGLMANTCCRMFTYTELHFTKNSRL